MNILILVLAIVTSFLLGAQVSTFVPLPLLWGIWAVIILIVLFYAMAKVNAKQNSRSNGKNN